MDRKNRLSKRQEKDTATRHGGRVTPMSGAGSIKNDVRSDEVSIECKYTEKISYQLKLRELAIAWVHAMRSNRRMAFVIEFVNPANTGTPGVPYRYLVQSEDDYLADQEELEVLREIKADYLDHLEHCASPRW